MVLMKQGQVSRMLKFDKQGLANEILDKLQKEIMRKGKPINQFVPENVPSANDVLERRSPQELISFKKLKRSFLGVTEKPKEIVRSIGSSLGLIKAKKASGPKSATKASGTRSARGPRKAK